MATPRAYRTKNRCQRRRWPPRCPRHMLRGQCYQVLAAARVSTICENKKDKWKLTFFLKTKYYILTMHISIWDSKGTGYELYKEGFTAGRGTNCSLRHRVHFGSRANPEKRIYPTPFPGAKRLKRRAHLHPVPRLRMPGAVSSLPPYNVMSW
jgi:hypothetical protein